jgi:hypothetical protein
MSNPLFYTRSSDVKVIIGNILEKPEESSAWAWPYFSFLRFSFYILKQTINMLIK